MLGRLRSSSFRRLVLVVVGIALIVFQILAYRKMQEAGDSLDYGTGIIAVPVFLGCWVYIIIGVISIITGLSMEYGFNNLFVRGNVIILTLALGLLSVIIQELCSQVVIYKPDYFTEYTLHEYRVDILVAVFAAMVCGPIPAIIVCLSFPYYYLYNNSPYIMTSQGSELVWYILTMIIVFITPVVFSHLTLLYLKNGKWKRLIISIIVSFLVSSLLSVSGNSFNSLLFTPRSSIEFIFWIVLTVVSFVLGVLLAVITGKLFKRYDKQHTISSDTRQKWFEEVEKVTGVSNITETINAQHSIRFCRRCGFELSEGSKCCTNCGTKIEDKTGD